MDTHSVAVPADPGAGVGKAGVVTPWETGNRGGVENWEGKGLGPSKPDPMAGNRKNSAGTGEAYKYPYEEKVTLPGANNKQD